jgi:hypothetical protein
LCRKIPTHILATHGETCRIPAGRFRLSDSGQPLVAIQTRGHSHPGKSSDLLGIPATHRKVKEALNTHGPMLHQNEGKSAVLFEASALFLSRMLLNIQNVVGGIVGGSGAGRDFLVQRRFQQGNKAFPLKHLAPAESRESCKLQSIVLWEQRAGGPLECFHGIPLAGGLKRLRVRQRNLSGDHGAPAALDTRQ